MAKRYCGVGTKAYVHSSKYNFALGILKFRFKRKYGTHHGDILETKGSVRGAW
jgi:hypothetical protein